MKKIMFTLLVFLLLFSSLSLLGCLQENTYSMCCDPDKAAAEDKCYPEGSPAPLETEGCDLEKSVCTATVSGKEELVPICAEKTSEELCVKPECMTMVCGHLVYTPELPKATKGGGIGGSDEMTEENVAQEMEDNEASIGLYDGLCMFASMDEKLKNVFTSVEGAVYLNTFRFGVLGSFAEYEAVKYYYPYSDVYCGGNSLGTVDRYMNYLLPPDKIKEHFCGDYDFNPTSYFSQDPEWDEIKKSPPFDTSAYSGESGTSFDGRYVTKSEIRIINGQYPTSSAVAEGIDEFQALYSGGYATGTYNNLVDDDFYAAVLPIIYYNDINTKGIAQFECKSGMDCLSANCDTSTYFRSVCKFNPEYGNEVEGDCGCEVKKDEDGAVTEVSCRPEKYTQYLTQAEEAEGIVPATLCNENNYNTYSLLEGMGKKSRKLTMDYCVNIVDYESEVDTLEDYKDYLSTSYEYALGYNKDVLSTVIDSVVLFTELFDEEENQISITESEGALLVSCSQIGEFTVLDHFVQPQDVDGWPHATKFKVKSIAFNAANGYEDITICYTDVTEADSPNSDYLHTTIKFGESPAIGAVTEMTPEEFKVSKLAVACDLKEGTNYEVTSGEEEILQYNEQYSGWQPGVEVGSVITHGYYFDKIPTAYNSEGEPIDWRFYNYYSNSIILITDLGKCENGAEMSASPDDTFGLYPTTKEYGWCAPCTYLTLASQKVEPIDPGYYSRAVAYIHNDEWNAFNDALKDGSDLMDADFEVTKVCNYPGKDLWNFELGIDYCIPEESDFGSKYATYDDKVLEGYEIAQKMPPFYTDPELTYLQKYSTKYFKEQVLPILDVSDVFSDSSDWNTGSASFPEELNYLVDINRGPATIIVSTLKWGSTDAELLDTLDRITAVEDACLTCLTAVLIEVKDAPAQLGNFDGEIRRNSDMFLIERLHDMGTFEFDNQLDLILFTFSPNEFTPTTCELTQEDQKAILANMSEYGYQLLQKFKKPSLIYRFYIGEEPDCWNVDSFYSFLTYLFTHQGKLTDAGITGLIFDTSDFNDEQMDSFIKSSQLMVAEKPILTLNRIQVFSESPYAIPCDTTGIKTGNCNIFSLNGIKCVLPPGATDESAYQCPGEIIIEPSQRCGEVTDTVLCTKTYANGTKEIHEYDVSTLTNNEADVIASLPEGLMCSLENIYGEVYSYTKDYYGAKQNVPIIYSQLGDPAYSCNPFIEPEMMNSFCGVTMPQIIKDYKLECIKK